MIRIQLKVKFLSKNQLGITLKTWRSQKKNTLKRDNDPNIDEGVPLDDTLEKTRNKHRPRIAKDHSISNVIGNVNEHDVTRRQSKLNELGFVCYTS